MIRDSKGSSEFWNLRVEQKDGRIKHMLEQSKVPAGDPTYAPQYAFEIVNECMHQMMRRYSRGDSPNRLSPYFVPLLEAWEESDRLGKEIISPERRYTRHAWAVNFDHYVVCFWLVGLALTLEIPDDQWNRLLALIGNEGEDILLDRIIASRSPHRRIGTQLCFKKPYARLLETIDSPKEVQPLKLLEFVTHWYDEIAVIGTSGRAKQATPYRTRTGIGWVTRISKVARISGGGASRRWPPSRRSASMMGRVSGINTTLAICCMKDSHQHPVGTT